MKQPIVVSFLAEKPFTAPLLAEQIGARLEPFSAPSLSYDWSEVSLMVIEHPYIGSRLEKTGGWRGIVWLREAIRHHVPIAIYEGDVLFLELTARGGRLNELDRWVIEGGIENLSSLGITPPEIYGELASLRYFNTIWHDVCADGPPFVLLVHHTCQGLLREWLKRKWQAPRCDRIFTYDPAHELWRETESILKHRQKTLFDLAGERQAAWFIDALRRKNHEAIDSQLKEAQLSWPITRVGGQYGKVSVRSIIADYLPQHEGTILWRESLHSEPPGHYRPRMHLAAIAGTPFARITPSFPFLAIPLDLVPHAKEVEELYRWKGARLLREIAYEQRVALLDIAPPEGYFLEETWPRVVKQAEEWWAGSEQARIVRRLVC